MVPDHVLFDSLEKTASNRHRLNEMIERYASVAALRLGMDATELRKLTGYSRARVVGIIERAEAAATDEDRRPPSDPITGRERIVRELPELVKLHEYADFLVHKLARISVIERKISANELARRTGHSRDFTQKWVKQIRAEGLHTVEVARNDWFVPQWEESEPVDPKYIVSPEVAEERRRIAAGEVVETEREPVQDFDHWAMSA